MILFNPAGMHLSPIGAFFQHARESVGCGPFLGGKMAIKFNAIAGHQILADQLGITDQTITIAQGGKLAKGPAPGSEDRSTRYGSPLIFIKISALRQNGLGLRLPKLSGKRISVKSVF